MINTHSHNVVCNDVFHLYANDDRVIAQIQAHTLGLAQWAKTASDFTSCQRKDIKPTCFLIKVSKLFRRKLFSQTPERCQIQIQYLTHWKSIRPCLVSVLRQNTGWWCWWIRPKKMQICVQLALGGSTADVYPLERSIVLPQRGIFAVKVRIRVSVSILRIVRE